MKSFNNTKSDLNWESTPDPISEFAKIVDRQRKISKYFPKYRCQKLLKETTHILLLFSAMNIYANNPGIDRMINELDKIYIS